ncbi:hypothetical protein [Amycolatopsis anabasis]|uniref:hypothetical protein n=1 Tax=Amycolatopsis anabasis TaxID=1840409 RepID=UPI0015D2AB6E|nr:hypothetical protein [Amycolatopsis anabasis]
MTWRVARALDTLLAQLNARAPNRSKASDGSIGDVAHASRNSDHNPWYIVNGVGVVTARDFTHDPRGGLDCQWLADTLVRSRDHRIKYLIWQRRILDTRPQYHPWQWRPYSGSNPHTKHLHISVQPNASCDDTRPWNLGTEDDMFNDDDRRILRMINSDLGKVYDTTGVTAGAFLARLAKLFPPIDDAGIAKRQGHSAGDLTNAAHSAWEHAIFTAWPRIQAIEAAQAEQGRKLDAILAGLEKLGAARP